MFLSGPQLSSGALTPLPSPHVGRVAALQLVLFLFYLAYMERIAAHSMAQAILAAPAWVRVGITAPTENIRVEAASELALTLLNLRDCEEHIADDRQLALAL